MAKTEISKAVPISVLYIGLVLFIIGFLIWWKKTGLIGFPVAFIGFIMSVFWFSNRKDKMCVTDDAGATECSPIVTDSLEKFEELNTPSRDIRFHANYSIGLGKGIREKGTAEEQRHAWAVLDNDQRIIGLLNTPVRNMNTLIVNLANDSIANLKLISQRPSQTFIGELAQQMAGHQNSIIRLAPATAVTYSSEFN